MFLPRKTIKIGNKIRIITICPEEQRLEFYKIHLDLSEDFESNPISEYVHCRMGRSVITNAKPHIGYSFTVKMDLRNFFYNVTLLDHGKYIRQEHRNKIFQSGRLPQGLPSSPSAANLAFAPSDEAIVIFCKKHNIIYTRYCDDLSFSFNDYSLIKDIKKEIPRLVNLNNFQINKRKTKVLYAKAGRRIICGVGVGSDGLHATRKSKRNLRTYQKNGQKLAAQGMQAWINHCENQ